MYLLTTCRLKTQSQLISELVCKSYANTTKPSYERSQTNNTMPGKPWEIAPTISVLATSSSITWHFITNPNVSKDATKNTWDYNVAITFQIKYAWANSHAVFTTILHDIYAYNRCWMHISECSTIWQLWNDVRTWNLLLRTLFNLS